MSLSLSLDSRYEQLLTSLNQISALFDMATSVDLTELNSETIANYFWVASDLINNSKRFCDALGNVSICT